MYAIASTGKSKSFCGASVSVVTVDIKLGGVGSTSLTTGRISGRPVPYYVLSLLCTVHLNKLASKPDKDHKY